MATPFRFLFVFGTRPEIIKLAPVIMLANRMKKFETFSLCTGQHDDLANDAISAFDFKVDYNADIMLKDQSINYILSRVTRETQVIIESFKPHILVVQGDTASALGAAMAGCWAQVPIAHVEAGLRSGYKNLPFPEEINRRVIDIISDILFPPTREGFIHLIKENHDNKNIHVTGNTVIDALKYITEKTCNHSFTLPGKPTVMVTFHRRENHAIVSDFTRMIRHLSEAYKESFFFIWPVHPHPNIHDIVYRNLRNYGSNLIITQPMNYSRFIRTLAQCSAVITDSGGVQEEATALGIPAFVIRDITERNEAVDYGSAILMGTEMRTMAAIISHYLSNSGKLQAIKDKCRKNTFGDGRASMRILYHLAKYLTS